MSKYCFSALLLLIFLLQANGQGKRVRGLRVGYDLSRLAVYYLESAQENVESDRREFEFSLDMEVKKDLYPTVEFGTANLQKISEVYEYDAEGYYFRLGLDRNFMKKYEINQYEMLFLGFRYGYSSFTHSAGNITIQDPYWGDFTDGAISPEALTAHWGEVTVGIRGEIFKNFFIGWSFRGRLLFTNPEDVAMTPYIIPGFGVYDNKRSSLGMTYSIYYRIPLYKVSYDE